MTNRTQETVELPAMTVSVIDEADVVVVGGGVSLIGEENFFVPLRNQVQKFVFPPLRNAYRIVPAALGEAVVVHGAIALAAMAESEQEATRRGSPEG